MTKLEFMKELESLLLDIPLEERDEALRYYSGYFEDAGEDQEEDIIKEIGSPTKVAAIIKADLISDDTERVNRGYFTEKGYQDTSYKDEKYEIVGTVKSNSDRSEDANNAKGSYSTNGSTNSSNNTNNANYTNGTQSSYNNYQQRKGNSNNSTLYLIIGIISFPVWFPLLMSAVGIAIGVIAAILGIIFGFGVAGVTMIGVGIALFFAGLIQISVPFIGVLLIGTGLLVLGIGMLFTIACILLCKNVLPAIIKGIVNLCRLPFKNRSVMA